MSISIFNEKNLQTIKTIRKGYLRGVLGLLIVLLAFWVIMILVTDKVFDVDGPVGKAETMFLTFIGCALLNVGAFRSLEVGNDKSKSFALVSLVTAIIAAILDVFLIWEVFPGEVTYFSERGTTSKLSIGAKMTIAMALTAVASWIESCVMRIKDDSSVGRVVLSVIVAFFYTVFLVSLIGIDITDKFALLIVVIPVGSLLIYFVSTRISALEGKEKKGKAVASEAGMGNAVKPSDEADDRSGSRENNTKSDA